MQNIPDIFNRIEQSSREQRELKKLYKDALLGTGEYEEIADKLKSLKERKKQIEIAVAMQLADESKKIEVLKTEIENDKQLLTDVALSKYVKGERIDFTTEQNVKYEPVFTVRFKRVK